MTGAEVDHPKSHTARKGVNLSLDRSIVDGLSPDLCQEHLCDLPVAGPFVEEASSDDCRALDWQRDVSVQIRWLQVGDVHAERLRVLQVHRPDL